MHNHIRLRAKEALNQFKHGDSNLTSSLQGAPKLNSQELQFALLKHDRELNIAKGSRRGKLDIIAEILLFCEQQKTKTSIMYNANLNYSQLKSQINALTTQGLLQKNLNKYLTTQKGYRFLELFAQINDLLDEFNTIK
jgi:predicted transcriptional regulator